jgi:hypothetical protein
MAPDGKHTNMLDLLVDNRWKTAVHVFRTFQGADISSPQFDDMQTEVKAEKASETKMT